MAGADLVARLAERLAALGLGRGPLLVAVSGGPDSVALLHALTQLAPRPGLVAGHVDHGIHPDSAAVAARVRALAASLGIAAEVETLALGPGASEAAAREARHAALERLRRRTGAAVVLTAHHADDQAETVLLRTLRGSGPAGLAAMAERSGTLVRPLLGVPRDVVRAHAADAGLGAWDDPANADRRHDRAWLRHDVLPALARRIPDVSHALRRVAAQAADDRGAWDALLDAWPELEVGTAGGSVSIAAAPLGRYDSRLASALVRAAARRAGCPLGPRRAERLLEWIRGGAVSGWQPLGGAWRAVLQDGRLAVVGGDAPVPGSILRGDDGVLAWGRWTVRWRREPAGVPERSGGSAWFAATALELRAVRPGDRIVPLGATGRRRVVRCLQEQGVAPLFRPNWPVLAAADDIVWLLGVCRGAGATAKPGEDALRVDVTES